MQLTQKKADQTINHNVSFISQFRSFDSILLVFLARHGSWLHMKQIDVQYIKIQFAISAQKNPPTNVIEPIKFPQDLVCKNLLKNHPRLKNKPER